MCFRFFYPISQEKGQLGTKHFIGMTLYELNLFSKRSILTHCGKKGVLAFWPAQSFVLYNVIMLCCSYDLSRACCGGQTISIIFLVIQKKNKQINSSY